MLGVLLLPAFTHLAHECQDLLSPCDRMHVCTDKTLVHTLLRKSYWGMESEPMLTPRGKTSLPEGIELEPKLSPREKSPLPQSQRMA